MLLVMSVHATCFGCTDYPHTFGTSYLKVKTKCVYILNLWDITNLKYRPMCILF